MANLGIIGPKEGRFGIVIETLIALGGVNSRKLTGNCWQDSLSEDVFYFINPDMDNTILVSTIYKDCEEKFFLMHIDDLLRAIVFKAGDRVVYKPENLLVKVLGPRWIPNFNAISYLIDLGRVVSAKDLGYEGTVDCTPVTELKMINEDLYEMKLDEVNFDYEIKEGKLVATRKDLIYFTTYEECCGYLGYDPKWNNISGFLQEDLKELQKLLICRKAYLTQYEVKFEKWEPTWKSYESKKYCIVFSDGKLKAKDFVTESRTFSFPTAEMRDHFMINFEDKLTLISNFT